MANRIWALLFIPATLLLAASSGAWLKWVPAADHAMRNPVAGDPEAIRAGSALYQDNCANCHGADGKGRGRRPPVYSARLASATDGDLYWLLTHGQPFRGMPAWSKLPEDQRWQIVAWLRSIQPETASPNGRGS
jgi:mono/diheme cytochrome c family protein